MVIKVQFPKQGLPRETKLRVAVFLLRRDYAMCLTLKKKKKTFPPVEIGTLKGNLDPAVDPSGS